MLQKDVLDRKNMNIKKWTYVGFAMRDYPGADPGFQVREGCT